MQGTVRTLYHYPVKGLSAQMIDHVTLAVGQGFPLDRAFGLARPDSGFDPSNPKPLPKTKFVVLARDAGLAMLKTHYDALADTLRVSGDGQDRTFDLGTKEGRDAVSAAISDHLGYADAERPTLYSAEPHKFTDVSVVSPAMMNAVSLINLESVADFSVSIDASVDAARFRGNILFDGIPPQAELDWIDREVTVGEVRLKIVQRTKRCPATEVNLETGRRDLDVPRLLRHAYGHSDMGVYAQVVRGGTIRPGDALLVA